MLWVSQRLNSPIPIHGLSLPRTRDRLKDGALLLNADIDGDGGLDIAVADMSDPAELRPFVVTASMELNPSVSPDARHVAYASLPAGVSQIYVRTFPESGGPWQVTNERGGRSPQWSPDGRELFYIDGGAMMAVSVETEPTFRVTGTTKLFEGPYSEGGNDYAVAPDGQRFLMIKESETSSDDLVVVLDWFEELKRLVPTSN